MRVAKPLALSGATPNRNPSSFNDPFCIHASSNAFVGEGVSHTLQLKFQVLYFTEKILGENLVVFRGSFPSPIDLAPSIRTFKVCAVSLPYLIYIAGLALSDLIGLTRLSWVSLLA